MNTAISPGDPHSSNFIGSHRLTKIHMNGLWHLISTLKGIHFRDSEITYVGPQKEVLSRPISSAPSPLIWTAATARCTTTCSQMSLRTKTPLGIFDTHSENLNIMHGVANAQTSITGAEHKYDEHGTLLVEQRRY